MKPNKLSLTAAFIAIKFYGLTLTDPYRSLFEKEVIHFYSNLVKNLPFPLKLYHSALHKKWVRSFFISLEERLLPGDLMHVLMRKYCIGHMVKKLIDGGYRQLVVLGAGFDHLAAYHSKRGIHSIELDAPRMADLKTSFVLNNCYNNKQLTIVPAYFTRDNLSLVLDILTDIDPEQKTIVVAEGFFDYFTPDQSHQILEDLSHFFSGQLALVSTVFSLEELHWLRSALFKSSVRIGGEKLRLHYSLAEFCSLLAGHNFIIDRHIPGYMMQKRHLWPRDISHPVLSGFHLLRALHN